MAVSISSSLGTGLLIPAHFFGQAKDLRFSSILCKSVNGPSLQSRGCRRRRRARVGATILQEDEERMVVEKSFPEREKGGSWSESCDVSSPPTGLKKWIIKLEHSVNILLTESVIKILDALYDDRDYARFYVLETIARVPYFAFMSVLHMYESFGWWRRADYMKVHFAESWNEMHHLLIMEELGGNSWWVDRFLAQNIAFFYYFMTAFMYVLSPRMAYHFSECVESHAFETYDKFIKNRKDELKRFPAPAVAVEYYTGRDLYLFDEFQTSRPPNSRRPQIGNLYDVFVNIRDDEAEHCKTMKACQTHGGVLCSRRTLHCVVHICSMWRTCCMWTSPVEPRIKAGVS